MKRVATTGANASSLAKQANERIDAIKKAADAADAARRAIEAAKRRT
ncbi:hypothetical protein [Streptomyces scopuliridis]